MRTMLLICVMVFTFPSFAAQFKTVTLDNSSKNYFSQIKFQKLLPATVAKAYQKINADLYQTLLDSGCDAAEAAVSEAGMDYNVFARIIALNEKYVAYEILDNSYCGGAHENHSTYYQTYNSQSGERVDIGANVAMQSDDVSYEEFEAYQTDLAQVIFNSADFKSQKNSCYEDLDEDSTVAALAGFYPYIAALAKNKLVLISVTTLSSSLPCALSVRVPMSEVAPFLKNESEIFSLINY
jgi:hypothetical protein